MLIRDSEAGECRERGKVLIDVQITERENCDQRDFCADVDLEVPDHRDGK